MPNPTYVIYMRNPTGPLFDYVMSWWCKEAQELWTAIYHVPVQTHAATSHADSMRLSIASFCRSSRRLYFLNVDSILAIRTAVISAIYMQKLDIASLPAMKLMGYYMAEQWSMILSIFSNVIYTSDGKRDEITPISFFLWCYSISECGLTFELCNDDVTWLSCVHTHLYVTMYLHNMWKRVRLLSWLRSHEFSSLSGPLLNRERYTSTSPH